MKPVATTIAKLPPMPKEPGPSGVIPQAWEIYWHKHSRSKEARLLALLEAVDAYTEACDALKNSDYGRMVSIKESATLTSECGSTLAALRELAGHLRNEVGT